MLLWNTDVQDLITLFSSSDVQAACVAFRLKMQTRDPVIFQWGKYIGISDLWNVLLHTDHAVIETSYRCTVCNVVQSHRIANNSMIVEASPAQENLSLHQLMQNWSEPITRCCSCTGALLACRHFISSPLLIAVETPLLRPTQNFHINVDGIQTEYKLIGSVHHGDSHFNTRVIWNGSDIWWYDGMRNNGNPTDDGKVSNDFDIVTFHDKVIQMALYKKI